MKSLFDLCCVPKFNVFLVCFCFLFLSCSESRPVLKNKAEKSFHGIKGLYKEHFEKGYAKKGSLLKHAHTEEMLYGKVSLNYEAKLARMTISLDNIEEVENIECLENGKINIHLSADIKTEKVEELQNVLSADNPILLTGEEWDCWDGDPLSHQIKQFEKSYVISEDHKGGKSHIILSVVAQNVTQKEIIPIFSMDFSFEPNGRETNKMPVKHQKLQSNGSTIINSFDTLGGDEGIGDSYGDATTYQISLDSNYDSNNKRAETERLPIIPNKLYCEDCFLSLSVGLKLKFGWSLSGLSRTFFILFGNALFSGNYDFQSDNFEIQAFEKELLTLIRINLLIFYIGPFPVYTFFGSGIKVEGDFQTVGFASLQSSGGATYKGSLELGVEYDDVLEKWSTIRRFESTTTKKNPVLNVDLSKNGHLDLLFKLIPFLELGIGVGASFANVELGANLDLELVFSYSIGNDGFRRNPISNFIAKSFAFKSPDLGQISSPSTSSLLVSFSWSPTMDENLQLTLKGRSFYVNSEQSWIDYFLDWFTNWNIEETIPLNSIRDLLLSRLGYGDLYQLTATVPKHGFTTTYFQKHEQNTFYDLHIYLESGYSCDEDCDCDLYAKIEFDCGTNKEYEPSARDLTEGNIDSLTRTWGKSFTIKSVPDHCTFTIELWDSDTWSDDILFSSKKYMSQLTETWKYWNEYNSCSGAKYYLKKSTEPKTLWLYLRNASFPGITALESGDAEGFLEIILYDAYGNEKLRRRSIDFVENNYPVFNYWISLPNFRDGDYVIFEVKEDDAFLTGADDDYCDFRINNLYSLYASSEKLTRKQFKCYNTPNGKDAKIDMYFVFLNDGNPSDKKLSLSEVEHIGNFGKFNEKKFGTNDQFEEKTSHLLKSSRSAQNEVSATATKTVSVIHEDDKNSHDFLYEKTEVGDEEVKQEQLLATDSYAAHGEDTKENEIEIQNTNLDCFSKLESAVDFGIGFSADIGSLKITFLIIDVNIFEGFTIGPYPLIEPYELLHTCVIGKVTSYKWEVGAWDECTVSGSFSERNVICIGEGTHALTNQPLKETRPDSYCSNSVKPLTQKICTILVYQWSVGSWSECFVNNQTKHRSVFCVSIDGQQQPQNALEDYCDQSTKPLSSDVCIPLTYEWVADEWGPCLAIDDSSVEEIRIRKVRCVNSTEGATEPTTVSDSICFSFGILYKPLSVQTCNSSISYQWSVGLWSECFIANQTKHRNVICAVLIEGETSASEVADIGNCNQSTKPDASKSCIPLTFTHEWNWQEWGPCTDGKQKRTIFCRRSDGQIVESPLNGNYDMYCDVTDQPISEKSCSTEGNQSNVFSDNSFVLYGAVSGVVVIALCVTVLYYKRKRKTKESEAETAVQLEDNNDESIEKQTEYSTSSAVGVTNNENIALSVNIQSTQQQEQMQQSTQQQEQMQQHQQQVGKEGEVTEEKKEAD